MKIAPVACAQLHAATATICVTVADFYPRVTFNGNVEYDALDLKNLFKGGSLQYMFGPTKSTNLAQLYKALGGGWQVAFPDEVQASVVDNNAGLGVVDDELAVFHVIPEERPCPSART